MGHTLVGNIPGIDQWDTLSWGIFQGLANGTFMLQGGGFMAAGGPYVFFNGLMFFFTYTRINKLNSTYTAYTAYTLKPFKMAPGVDS